MDQVTIRGWKSFDVDFPPIAVAPRRGGRSQDSKDWWGARRSLFALYEEGILSGGCRLRKIPETNLCATPDFELCSELGFSLLEITEATHGSDQREMTTSEAIDGGHLLGAHGGRGARGFGGDEPYKMVAADVELAVDRKRHRYAGGVRSLTVLGIYINSNPGFVVQDLTKVALHLERSQIDAAGFRNVILFKDRADAHLVLGKAA